MKQSPVPHNATVGICIATHAALPYVHTHLECLNRHEPNGRVLIHDDCSHQADQLKSIGAEYGADFVTTPSRRVPTVGDLSAFVEALQWGEREGLDVVVKCSRRFIINKPWSRGLVELMHNSQYATACAPCSHYGFGYRSELVAMHVRSWIDSGACAEMSGAVERNQQYDPLPEAYDHWRARDVHKFVHPVPPDISHSDNVHHSDVDYLVRSESMYPRSSSYDAYVWWINVMGLARHQQMPDVYWHDSHVPPHYAELAAKYGLPYSVDDFLVIPGN